MSYRNTFRQFDSYIDKLDKSEVVFKESIKNYLFSSNDNKKNLISNILASELYCNNR